MHLLHHVVYASATGLAYSALPWLTSALKDPKARAYFLALGAVLVTVYNLNDLDVDPNE